MDAKLVLCLALSVLHCAAVQVTSLDDTPGTGTCLQYLPTVVEAATIPVVSALLIDPRFLQSESAPHLHPIQQAFLSVCIRLASSWVQAREAKIRFPAG